MFHSEGGSKGIPTSKFSAWLKPDDRQSTNVTKDLKKVARSPLQNRLGCGTGKLKSFPIIYSSSTREYNIMN